MKIQNGIKTSEFWMTLLPTIVAMLVVSGVISSGDTDYIVSISKDIIAGVVAVISIIRYITSRTDLKKEIVKQSSQNVG